jgi:hypothetical protein
MDRESPRFAVETLERAYLQDGIRQVVEIAVQTDP